MQPNEDSAGGGEFVKQLPPLILLF